eukprot:SAG31_NODE_21033_length_559_cov_1.110870_1_plen_147_part_10
MTYPSKATLQDGSRYNYSVAYSSWQGGNGDVVGDFVKSCNRRGIGIGYYYSLSSNNWATQHNLSAAALEDLEMQQLAELWGDKLWGNEGNLTELWCAPKPDLVSKFACYSSSKVLNLKCSLFQLNCSLSCVYDCAINFAFTAVDILS